MDEKPVTWKFILLWCAIVGGLFMAFEFWQRVSQGHIVESVSHSTYQEVTLVRGRDHHYRLNGFVNGVKVHFLLDTGASKVSLPKSIADEANVTGHVSVYVNTANGTTQATLSRIKHLKFGAIELKNVSTVIMDNNSSVALLGMSALKKIEMIKRGDKLILRHLVK